MLSTRIVCGVGLCVSAAVLSRQIRTAMLKDHKPIDLEAGQEVTVVSVGDAYDTWEGFKDPSTGSVGRHVSRKCIRNGSESLRAVRWTNANMSGGLG